MNEVKMTPAALYLLSGATASIWDTEDKVLPDANIHGGDTPIWDFAKVAPSAAGVCADALACKTLDDSFSDIGDAIITKIHGTTPYKILAKVEDSYTTPGSVTPTVLIPSHFFIKDSLRLKMKHDATDKAFENLYLIADSTASAVDFVPSEQEGSSGYPLIEIAFPTELKDAYSINAPGGSAPESTMLKTGVDIFVVIDGELQLFGCTQNEAPLDLHPEFVELLKGAQAGVEAVAVDTRPMTITGNVYSNNGWIWENLYGAADLGFDGVYQQYEVSVDYTNWKSVEIVLSSFTMEGRLFRVWAPRAFIRSTGALPMGSAEVMHPFEIKLGKVAYPFITRDLYSVYRFAMNQEIGA